MAGLADGAGCRAQIAQLKARCRHASGRIAHLCGTDPARGVGWRHHESLGASSELGFHGWSGRRESNPHDSLEGCGLQSSELLLSRSGLSVTLESGAVPPVENEATGLWF